MAESFETKLSKIATATILQAKANKRKFSEFTSALDILVQEYEKQKAAWQLEAETNHDAIENAKSEAYEKFKKAMEDIEEQDQERIFRMKTAMALKVAINEQLEKHPFYEYNSSTDEWKKK